LYIHEMHDWKAFLLCASLALGALFWYKTGGGRGLRWPVAMLFSLKGLASTLLLSTAIFGTAVDTAEHLEKRAQAKGIDISSRQGHFNWGVARLAGYSFAYIQATDGEGKGDGTLVVRGADTSSRLQEPILPLPVHWRHQYRFYSRWLPPWPS
jgi:hypothetical protein